MKKEKIFVLFKEDYLVVARKDKTEKVLYTEKSAKLFDDTGFVIGYGLTYPQYSVIKYLMEKRAVNIKIKDILDEKVKTDSKIKVLIFDLKHINSLKDNKERSLSDLCQYYDTKSEIKALQDLFEDSKELIKFQHTVAGECDIKPKYTSLQGLAKYIVLSKVKIDNSKKEPVKFKDIIPLPKFRNSSIRRALNIVYNTLQEEVVRINTFKTQKIKFLKDLTVENITPGYLLNIKTDKELLPIKWDITGLNYYSKGIYEGNIISVDFNNFYPSLVVNNKLSPRALSKDDFLKVYIHLDMLNKFSDVLFQGENTKAYFKKMLNSIVGKSLNRECKWHDEYFWLSITMKGAVLMLELIDLILSFDTKIIHINKDGVIFTCNSEIKTAINYFMEKNSHFYKFKQYNKAIIHSLTNTMLIGEETVKKGVFNDTIEPFSKVKEKPLAMILSEYYLNGRDIPEIIAEKHLEGEIKNTIFGKETQYEQEAKKYIITKE